MRILFSVWLLFLTHFLKGENNLLLCTEIDHDGKCLNTYDNWSIQKTGNFIYLLYQSDNPIDDTLYVNIQKTFSRKDSNYYYYDYYYLVPDAAKKWASNKYTFTAPGNYRISVYNRKTEQLLGTLITTINYAEDEYAGYNFADTWYFSESKIAFCEAVINGKLIGEEKAFKQKAEGNTITLYLEQNGQKALKTDHLYLKIYAPDECNRLVASFESSIERSWYWTFVKIYLKNKGKYLVEVYTQDDVYINSGVVEIN